MKTAPAFALTIATLLALQGCGSISPQMASWEDTGGPYAQNVTALLAEAKRPGHLMAGLSTGELFASSDGGRSWGKISASVPRVPITKIIQHPEQDAEFYSPTEAGLFASTDGGKTWNLAGPRSADFFLPKIIHGSFGEQSFPWINFDWHPIRKPITA